MAYIIFGNSGARSNHSGGDSQCDFWRNRSALEKVIRE